MTRDRTADHVIADARIVKTPELVERYSAGELWAALERAVNEEPATRQRIVGAIEAHHAASEAVR